MNKALSQGPAEAFKPLRRRPGLAMIPMAVATALVVLPFIVGGCSSKTGGTHAAPSNRAQQEPSNQPSTTPEAAKVVFNVPSLVGKNIDQIRRSLGRPIDKAPAGMEPPEPQLSLIGEAAVWDNTFRKNGEELLVTFNARSRRVVDFFISARSQDKKRLLRIGNVDPNSQNYRIEYVQNLADPSQITGVKVIPNK